MKKRNVLSTQFEAKTIAAQNDVSHLVKRKASLSDWHFAVVFLAHPFPFPRKEGARAKQHPLAFSVPDPFLNVILAMLLLHTGIACTRLRKERRGEARRRFHSRAPALPFSSRLPSIKVGFRCQLRRRVARLILPERGKEAGSTGRVCGLSEWTHEPSSPRKKKKKKEITPGRRKPLASSRQTSLPGPHKHRV